MQEVFLPFAEFVERFLKIMVDNRVLFVYNNRALKNIAGWSSPVARRAHNPKVGGSNPPPATKKKQSPTRWLFSFSLELNHRPRVPEGTERDRSQCEKKGVRLSCSRPLLVSECETNNGNDKWNAGSNPPPATKLERKY